MRAQASLEMTVALVGALLILFASLKTCVWFSDRLVQRQRAYEWGTGWLEKLGMAEGSRMTAGNSIRVLPPLPFLGNLNDETVPDPVPWTEPSEPLRIFSND